VTSDYATWLEQVAPRVEREPGFRPLGAEGFLREVFERRGPVSIEELDAEAHRAASNLARTAVDLVLHDLHATTDARPLIELRDDEEYGVIVSYNGGYTTPAFDSMEHPEATCEIADYLQGEIVEDVWTVWPTCPSHHGGLHARSSEGGAYWYCRAENHQVAAIGQLAP
jgi:hypothetical protein